MLESWAKNFSWVNKEKADEAAEDVSKTELFDELKRLKKELNSIREVLCARKNSLKSKSILPPYLIRFTKEERTLLEKLRNGVPLAKFIKGVLFSDTVLPIKTLFR